MELGRETYPEQGANHSASQSARTIASRDAEATSKKLQDLQFEAAILDLDGVITRTAKLHARAWKRLFDEFREQRLTQGHPLFEPFDEDRDYKTLIDGLPRIVR